MICSLPRRYKGRADLTLKRVVKTSYIADGKYTISNTTVKLACFETSLNRLEQLNSGHSYDHFYQAEERPCRSKYQKLELRISLRYQPDSKIIINKSDDLTDGQLLACLQAPSFM